MSVWTAIIDGAKRIPEWFDAGAHAAKVEAAAELKAAKATDRLNSGIFSNLKKLGVTDITTLDSDAQAQLIRELGENERTAYAHHLGPEPKPTDILGRVLAPLKELGPAGKVVAGVVPIGVGGVLATEYGVNKWYDLWANRAKSNAATGNAFQDAGMTGPVNGSDPQQTPRRRLARTDLQAPVGDTGAQTRGRSEFAPRAGFDPGGPNQ